MRGRSSATEEGDWREREGGREERERERERERDEGERERERERGGGKGEEFSKINNTHVDVYS